MLNTTNPLNNIADPSVLNTPGRPGTASHNSSSTSKNTGNETKTNNREILMIKMIAEKSKRQSGYCTQVSAKTKQAHTARPTWLLPTAHHKARRLNWPDKPFQLDDLRCSQLESAEILG